MIFGNKKAQLFLIEIIVALSILFILITALFSTQEVTNPTDTNNLETIGVDILQSLKNSQEFYTYLDQANYSYYDLGNSFAPFFDDLNQTKRQISNSIDGVIPVIAGFKGILERFDKSLQAWLRIDVVNFESYIPSGSEIVVNEIYVPSVLGQFDQYKFRLQLWYEVQV